MATRIETLRDRLSRVQTAIAAIEGGAQSWSMDGTSFTRANLSDLYEREARLEAAIANGRRSGGIMRGVDFTASGYGSGYNGS